MPNYIDSFAKERHIKTILLQIAMKKKTEFSKSLPYPNRIPILNCK